MCVRFLEKNRQFSFTACTIKNKRFLRKGVKVSIKAGKDAS